MGDVLTDVVKTNGVLPKICRYWLEVDWYRSKTPTVKLIIEVSFGALNLLPLPFFTFTLPSHSHPLSCTLSFLQPRILIHLCKVRYADLWYGRYIPIWQRPVHESPSIRWYHYITLYQAIQGLYQMVIIKIWSLPTCANQ